jgi:hypothetical protein
MIQLFIFGGVLVALIYYDRLNKEKGNSSRQSGNGSLYEATEPAEKLRYNGEDLSFTDEEYEYVLNRHFGYYSQLRPHNQKIFIERLKNFISDKIFIIHDEEGFKEMPILVSATAIQITFGLDGYLLPHFRHLQIYPEEFLRTYPYLCFLEGNVSGKSIRLSWKHFLRGIQNENDGQHVGLHEMAHALYYQHFIAEHHNDRDFRKYFEYFNDDSNEVYQLEQAATVGLYSRHAMKNLQEFWAESVEIFFEKSFVLYQTYPSVYLAVEQILNQNPILLLNEKGSTDHPA